MHKTLLTWAVVIGTTLGSLVPFQGLADPTNSVAGRFRDWKDAGCRMSPGRPGMPPSEANNAAGNRAYCSACSDDDGQPRWWIDSPYQNLFITDQPLSYFDSAHQKVFSGRMSALATTTALVLFAATTTMLTCSRPAPATA
jgi:hypothetical protein